MSPWKVQIGALTEMGAAGVFVGILDALSPVGVVSRRRTRQKLGQLQLALGAVTLAAFSAWGAAAQDRCTPPSASPRQTPPPPELVVTASRLNVLGAAVTASQGSVTKEEVELRPIYRIGELYETVPGLVVTIHSGEGKASQYLLRGFNLDHGTDFASFVDGMPVNRPTNTHGQGYSDQNFLMPELVDGLDFTKGPYYAAIGDSGAVGSAHIRLANQIPDQISASAGSLGDQNVFAGGTSTVDQDDRIWAAVEGGHVDGPWSPSGDFEKFNAAARFSHGTGTDGYSLTALYYRSAGRLETDQSVYAIQEGLIRRFGTLDPSDRSRSERYSLSAHYGAQDAHWRFSSNLYAIHDTMTLWNDFTHYRFDQVNGDQEQQDESRTTLGGDAAVVGSMDMGGIHSETSFGVQNRYDQIYLDRRHTQDRRVLNYCELAGPLGAGVTVPTAPSSAPPPNGLGVPYLAVGLACSADRVALNDLGLFAENTTRWTSWIRTVLGVREEDYWASDHSLTTGFSGAQSQALFQPKGSLVFGPWWKTEVYLSAGEGFHSDDVRGVFGTVPLEGIPAKAGKTPLLAPAAGEEIGLRTHIISRVQLQFALFQEDFKSELAYDQDQGEDQPSAPSRRQGVELSGQYHPFSFLEFNADLAVSKARYHGSNAELLADYGLAGPFIANAPSFIGSLGILVDKLGPWFGGLQWRDLGPYPVADGFQYPQDKGYSEINVDVGYKLTPKVKLQVGIYNLLDSRADAAAYDYTSRLTPTGPEVTGLQVHPLEPISARFTLTALF